MLEATCHCGAVRIGVPRAPDFLVDCNCSICRRNGALWAFYDADSVALGGDPEKTTPYVWGARTICTMHCTVCGCATHWEPLDPAAGARIGINARNFNPRAIAGTRVRKFDGAQTWTYLD